MAILDILHYPDKRLRKRAQAVSTVDAKILTLLDNMLETMYEAKGIGLAATQVNVPWRVVVIDVSENRDEPLFLINPEVVWSEGTEKTQEGCLSVPEYFDWVERAEKIGVKALDKDGQQMEFEAEGLLAVCIQHEIDHLDGKLFVDYLSGLKRQRLRKKVEKASRLAVTNPVTL